MSTQASIQAPFGSESAPAVEREENLGALASPITTVAEHMAVLWGPPDQCLDDAALGDLVDRLAVYDVTYLGGGSKDAHQPDPYREPAHAEPADISLPALIQALAQTPNGRLRDAMIALLLRHPEHMPVARGVLAALPAGDPARRALLARLLAAAALQRIGAAGLTPDGILPTPIDITDLVAALALPAPSEGDGTPLLQAAAALLAGPLPVDWIGGWRDVLAHVLQEVAWTQTTAPTRP